MGRWHSTVLRAAALALALVLLAVAGRAPGVAQDSAPLVERLRTLVREADLGEKVGVCVRDARTGREIFSHHKELALNPASNMKIVTAAAALRKLGGDFRMHTGLYGEIGEAGRVEALVLRGQGDPTLRMSDLVELAEQLADRGVRRVGTVVVDGTYFDGEILPPAFDQQPNEVAAFRAPISAVAVERSAYVLRVLPGPEPGAPANVRLAADGYFALESEIVTSEGGAPDVVAIQRPKGTRMELLLRGSIPTGILGVGYRRRVENPLSYAGYAMVEALDRAGIRAGGEVRVGPGPDGTPLITSRKSPPVEQVIAELGKYSDNFVAEMILKVLGAERARPGTSRTGAAVLQDVLAEAGVPEGQAQIVNGSGLFEGNRIAADHLARLLVMMYRDPAVRSEYLSTLAVGGVDGTLHRRLRKLPADRIVRAKTGTLADAIALSGYVLGPEPERALAFSVLANGVRGKQAAARRLADDVVGAVAAHLHGS